MMFQQILFLNWKGSRLGMLPFMVAAFALPILSVQGLVPEPGIPEIATARASTMLSNHQTWVNFFPGLAFAMGSVLALMSWNWDHRGEHIYALTLPIHRWQYVAMKMGSGCIVLLLPVLLFWVGCLLASSFTDLPEGLRTYPTALSFRFFLATLLSFAILFTLAAGTMKTAVIFLCSCLLLVVLGEMFPAYLWDVFEVPAMRGFSLFEWVMHGALEWPGPFEIYTGNWMLIDV